jgi:serine/threonine protein kinase
VEKKEQWQRVKEIVGVALEKDLNERGAFLDQACLQDGALRAEVESLLAAHADADGLSEHPWGLDLADPAAESKTVGPYRLVRELGVGGMGQVWLAEQTEPVRRQVALKLIKAGMYDAAVIQRFQAERQSLAIMDHPTIAKVFDAGATPAGQPYFVMEYVDGLSITDYCDRKKLGIRERLKLFIQVCEGVQHAHQKAIIHRDLKPSNILVVEVDGKPTPRIIDFGLAKATEPPAPGETLFTQAGTFLGTPGYMSPEQADPDLRDIDTRTDVYSLGVVLYELLTGFLPFDTAQWKKQRLDEVLRQLRETDPQRPSTKVSTNRDTSTARAVARSTEAGQLVTLLRGDLDWITMKALEKDRERRYETPSALAVDVENYLENRPVAARPASTAYRMRKYARRHALGVGVGAGAAVLLIAFAVMQAVELRRITRERDRADRITELMTNMFKVSDPSEARGNSITAREILDKSSTQIDTGLAKDPELKAQMLHVMGTVYQGLGLFSRAEPLLKQAVEIRRSVLGPEHPDTLASTGRLARIIQSEGRYAEAAKLEREVVSVEERVLGPDHRTTLAEESSLAWTLVDEGHPEEAEKLCQPTLERQRRVLGIDDPDTLESMRRLAWILAAEGRYAEAEKIGRETLDRRKRVLGAEDLHTLLSMSELGVILIGESKDDEAEPLLRQTLEIQRRILGAAHQSTTATAGALGAALEHEHHYADAEQLDKESLAAQVQALGPDHPNTLTTMGNLATIFDDEHRYPEAEKLHREVLARRRRVLGPDHPDIALALFNIADVLYHEHRYPESATVFREAADIQRRALGANHPDTLESTARVACVLALMHKKDEAISTLREAFERGLDLKTLAEIDKYGDLKSLHGDPRFEALATEAQKRSAAIAQKTN